MAVDERIKNIKIAVHNEEISNQVQDKLVELGCHHCKLCYDKDNNSIFTSDRGDIGCITSSKKYFDKRDEKEIYVEDLLAMEKKEDDKVEEAKSYRKYFEMLREEDNRTPIDIEYSFRNEVGGGRMTTCSLNNCKECGFYRDLYISAMAYGMLREYKNQIQTKEKILEDFANNEYLNTNGKAIGNMRYILDKYIGGNEK